MEFQLIFHQKSRPSIWIRMCTESEYQKFFKKKWSHMYNSENCILLSFFISNKMDEKFFNRDSMLKGLGDEKSLFVGFLKWGASFRWSFGPKSDWESIETTIGKRHSTLLSKGSFLIIILKSYKWIFVVPCCRWMNTAYPIENQHAN